jgi:hypothetical protein
VISGFAAPRAAYRHLQRTQREKQTADRKCDLVFALQSRLDEAHEKCSGRFDDI